MSKEEKQRLKEYQKIYREANRNYESYDLFGKAVD